MCKPFFPMLNPANPPPGFPSHNTSSQQYYPLLSAPSGFPGPPQGPPPRIPQRPPAPVSTAPTPPSNGAAYMQPGPYAKLGVFIDTQNTTKTDREIAQELGQRYGCHTCGNQPGPGQSFVADHQPPSNFYNGFPLDPPSIPLYEFTHSGELFQTTDPNLAASVGATAKPSTFGQHQFVYPQCPNCSNKQGGFVRGNNW